MSQTTIQWHLEEGMDDDRFTDVKRGTDTMCVCSGYDRVERYQRAAFIVQACNSHDILVEALRAISKPALGGKWQQQRAREALGVLAKVKERP